MGTERLTDVAVELKHETKKAWLIYDGVVETWIAKSQAELHDGILTLPEWLAKEKRLI